MNTLALTENKSISSVRNSNLELYRIIVMILIIAHHYVVNSGVLELMYRLPLSTKSIYMFFLGAWGKVGINCYIFITGYFMCKKEITLKKYSQLIIEILFYNVGISFIFFIVGIGSLRDVINSLIIIRNIDSGNFTACFLMFYLLIPFLNILINNINEIQHRFLIGILFFLYIFLGTMPKFSVTMNYVSWFCYIYLVSSYIRFYEIKKRNWGGVYFIIYNFINYFYKRMFVFKLNLKQKYGL